MRHCPICSASFPNFLPLPAHYFEAAALPGITYSMEDLETLNIGQYSCPRCHASDRDRLYALYIQRLFTPDRAPRVLEIAPTPGLSGLLQGLPDARYRSADLFSPLAMDKVDITDMACYADDSFDLIVCSHVLEHVDDDRAAIRELYRVLAPGGHAILMVPILMSAEATDEDPQETDPLRRTIRFGQDDHVRMYAKWDFMARLSYGGFELDALDEACFIARTGQGDVFRRHGISRQSVLYVGRKPLAVPPRGLGDDGASWAPDCEVTVAMPAYKPQFFERALRSALAQRGVDFEVLICDDSPDGCIQAIAERLAAESAVSLRYEKNPANLGERDNVARCIELARGRFVKLLYDDDVLLPGCLQDQAAVLREQPEVALVGGRRLNIDERDGPMPETLPSYFPFPGDCCVNGRDVVSLLGHHTLNFIGEPVAVMFRRDDARAFMDEGLFRLNGEFVKWFGDVVLYVKLLRRGHLVMLSRPQAQFRLSMHQESQRARSDQEAGRASHEKFKSLLQSLGWVDGPIRTIGIRRVRDDGAFEPFDVLLRWKMWMTNLTQRGQPAAPPYVHWLDLLRQRWAQTAPSLLARPPCAPVFLAVAIDVAGGGEQALRITRDSVQSQSRAPDDCVVGLPVWDALARHPEGWTLLLCAGDQLEPHALQYLERAVGMARQRQAVIVAFDHDEWHAHGEWQSPVMKPGTNPDLLLSMPYTGRALLVENRWAQDRLGNAGTSHDLGLAYHLALCAARREPGRLLHVPMVLAHLNGAVPYLFVHESTQWQQLAKIVQAHLCEHEPGAQLLEGPAPGTFHVIHPLTRTPKVSIVIPTRDQLPFLSRCIESLLDKTDYPDFEILVVDNDSQTAEAQAFLSGLEVVDPERIRVLRVPGAFNFSCMNNLAVAQARGEFILLLNNDTAALHADWLSHMMRHALRDGVGIVGARLLYPEGTVQHAGVIMGLRGPAEHPCLGFKADEPGYMFRAQVTQNFSAVTAACMLVSKAVYEEVGGLDEEVFAVSYNDVDFCLRVGRTGRRIVWTPLATLLHEGSASQKASIETLSSDKKAARFTREQAAMYERWPDVIANDPAYNPNLTLVERGYEVETNPLLCHDPLKGLVDHRVVAFAADPHGCGHYRILQPMQAMLDAGLCTGGASPELFGPNLALRSGADTLVFQRPFTDANLSLLESLLPLKNVLKVYEVDDDLSRVPMKNSHRDQIPKDIRARMMRNIGVCDRLVVSTEFLAHQFRGANGDIRVVQNRLPRALWGNAPPAREARDMAGRKPVVGWAGGVSHQGDLELIAQVVKETADQVDWVFMGMCPEPIRPYVKAFHTGVPTPDYPKRLMEITRDWDLAVAPLELNAFNEAKSNLRLLEYGWCGLPVICTDITPYQCDLPAVRVKNRFKDWRAAILDAVNDLPATRQRGQDLQARVEADWMLEGRHLEAWYRAWTDR